MKSQFYKLKPKTIALRKEGKTYSEIRDILDTLISKSTLSYWCKNIELTARQKERIDDIIKKNRIKSRTAALVAIKIKRQDYIRLVQERVSHLKETIKNRDVAKIALAMLYLGEGSKSPRSSLVFGNSNPIVIAIFLELLRYCYDIDESKFRCTLQCRADQNIEELQRFWLNTTKIPFSQFYKAQIDQRTIGKPSKKVNYKGVCRINYFSADIFTELKQIVEIIYKGR